MSTANAYLFFVLGCVLRSIPLLAPGHFLPHDAAGVNTSAAWLEFMGWLNASVGTAYVVQLQLLPWLDWIARPLPEAIGMLEANESRPAVLPFEIQWQLHEEPELRAAA